MLQVLKKGISAGSFTSYRSALPDSPSLVALNEDPKTIAVVKAFKLQSAAELKVVLSAMILSECVYKLVDVGPADSAKAASTFVSQLPPGLVSLQHVQSVAASVPHRYMLGDDGQSLYVVFMGTKHMRDLLADANVLQEAVWKSKDPDKQQANALAHRGFLARARGIPVEALYAHAKRQGRRLVLCGHSLGGAVALLCTLRLLQGLPKGDPSLYCICFGTPAIGNAALAALVAEYGWESHILNFILPEDIIPRILALPAAPSKLQPASLEQQQQQGTASANTQANLSMPALAQAPTTVRNRLQNLHAILTAKAPCIQQLDTATDQQAQSADGKPATQVPSIDETLQAANSLLSGNSPGPSDWKKPSQTESDQENGIEQQSSRLQALRAAIAARWPPKQQQQAALGLDAKVELGRTGKTERQSEPATKPQQDEAAMSAVETGSGVPASPSGLFHSLRGRLQRQSAKQVAESLAELAVSGNPDRLVNPPQDGESSVSSREGKEQIAAEQAESGKPLLQGIRSFTSRLPGLNRSHPGTLSQALPPDSGTHPNSDSSSCLAQAASADELDSAQQQQQQVPKQPSTLWGLDRVQGAWEGASSRLKAMRALLPAYPAYVHIGSHQILLPASPAMTEAVKSAQQKGLAEEGQQALIMHRMSAYRGRAIAICRSVFHWEPMASATQISLSTTLSPPVTLLHATVIIPPLPLLPTDSTTPAEAATQPASQAVADRQSVQLLVQSHQPLQALEQQPSTSSSQQHQGRSPQQEENLWTSDPLVEQLQQQRQPAASAKHKPPRLGSGTVQLDPDTAPQEQEAPRQAAKHKSPNRQRQREQQVQSVNRPKGSSGAKFEPNPDPKPGRWLPPVGVRWQGKPRHIPRLSVFIRVQGSVHSMPAQAKLQVLGHHWCKAQLISHTAQHSIRQLPMVLSQQLPKQLQPQSWRQKLLRTLPWLQPQAAHHQAQAHHADVILIQAEVPVTLLQTVVQDTELQLLQRLAGQQQASPRDEAAKQDVPIMQQQQPPAMLLKIETDFVCKEQAVHAHLPVTWVLGDDTRASQDIWQLLTSAKQQSGPHAQQQGGDRLTDSDGKKPESRWQAAQTRLRSALTTSWRQRDLAEQHPRPQLVTAVISGVQYALIRPTSTQYVELLSCVLLTLSCLAGDQHTMLSLQQAEASLQNLPSRIRAAYHMQQLQQLQQQLQELGSPSGVIMLHTGSIDTRSEGALSLIAKQASRMNIMRMGVSMTDHMASEALYGITADDWIRLPVGAGVEYSEHLQRLHQKLRGSLAAILQSLKRKQSRL
ncbi:TPA: hypothetical protein ACH3X1_002100 [Trebouxia sp. C0004]